MKEQFEVSSCRPAYGGGWIVTWKCRSCGQSGEGRECGPAFHVCPPKPHKHEVE